MLLAFYILSLLFDFSISAIECKHNPNFYEEEVNKGFADLCSGQDHGHWYLSSMVFLEPVLAIFMAFWYFSTKLNRLDWSFLLIVWLFVFKTVSHLVGGMGWLVI